MELGYNYRLNKKCPNCGKKITDKAITCSNCIPERLESIKRNKEIYKLWKTGKYKKRKLADQFEMTPTNIGIIIYKEKQKEGIK